MSKIGALVAYKSKPAKVVSATTHKYEITFSDGTSQKVREKDFRFIHPEFNTINQDCPDVDASILFDLDAESFSLQEITEWLFDDFTPQSAWYVYLMSEDSLYFYWNKDLLILRTQEQIQLIKNQRKDKVLEQESLNRCIKNLENNVFDDENIFWINEIEQVALNQLKHSKVMRALSIENSPENAHSLLIKINYWSEFNNPYPQRNKIYPDEDLEFDAFKVDRKDLTHLTCLAIDNSYSIDADDAISIDGDRIWIHIADVASFVDIDSELDMFARKRISNLYLPDQIFHMLPPMLSEACSLGANDVSNAISIGFVLNEFEVNDIQIHLSLIKVTKMSYEMADKQIKSNKTLAALNEIAKVHKAYRDGNGAIQLNLPNTDIKLKDRKVHIFPQTVSESRSLVSEMMILAGRVIAEFSVENSISMPYLSQEPGSFSDDVIKNINNLSPSKAFEAARGFNRSKLSVKHSLHSGLGLEAYLRVTSPMRRYLDLLVQQQLVRFLSKSDLLNDSDIKERIKVVNASVSKVNKATRQSVEHFRCVYFKQNKKWEGEGVIVETKGQKASVLIPALAMITQIKFKSKVDLEQRIKLEVISSNLFERSIDFKPL
ncbi:ribonuclease catalytic domain-containing protein [Candidatus Pseudothioglobus singularis]|nr:ribonuclease catalytic domain-containing protein [Candidatus Pseudothioglobus singularis]